MLIRRVKLLIRRGPDPSCGFPAARSARRERVHRGPRVSRARELLAEGPPFDPAPLVYAGGDHGAAPKRSSQAAAFLCAGTPRLAHEAYLWEEGE